MHSKTIPPTDLFKKDYFFQITFEMASDGEYAAKNAIVGSFLCFYVRSSDKMRKDCNFATFYLFFN